MKIRAEARRIQGCSRLIKQKARRPPPSLQSHHNNVDPLEPSYGYRNREAAFLLGCDSRNKLKLCCCRPESERNSPRQRHSFGLTSSRRWTFVFPKLQAQRFLEANERCSLGLKLYETGIEVCSCLQNPRVPQNSRMCLDGLCLPVQ